MRQPFVLTANFRELNDRNFDQLLFPQLKPLDRIINEGMAETGRFPDIGCDGFLIDLSRVTFANPYGALGVVCLSELLYFPLGRKVRLILPRRRQVGEWLARLGFLEAMQPTAEIPDAPRPQRADRTHAAESRYLPVTKIASWEDTYRAVEEVVKRCEPMLVHALQYDRAEAARHTTIVAELCQNIYYHSAPEGSSPKGYVAAQLTRGKNVKLAVMDFGQGIPATLRRNYPNEDDRTLIEKAFQAQVTSKLDKGGLGLYRTAQIVKQAQGILNVRSGNAKVVFSPQGDYTQSGEPMDYQERFLYGWGTQIGILLPMRAPDSSSIATIRQDGRRLKWQGWRTRN